MKNWWVKFGCFLTGYNYDILICSSEVAVKALKRYTSAMLIVCLLWSFIGYVFTERYMKAGVIGAIVGAATLCFIIVQIERQIILATHSNKLMHRFRVCIALAMALIGSIIVDQIIFQKDIELGKIESLNAKINKVLPDRTKDIKSQIVQLDQAVINKEGERQILMADITSHPTIKSVSSQSRSQPVITSTQDSSKNTKQSVNVVNINSVAVSYIPNPNIGLLNPLNEQLNLLRKEKSIKEASLIKLRSELEKEISEKTGFLDELIVMVNLIKGSVVALLVWLLWLSFLIGIELFVLVSKRGNEENDYDLTIKHHMELQKRKLRLMAAQIAAPDSDFKI
ncbi:DUF4407 domain-containing protein [Mucilaginibacter lutimaris]|uniref:DUF4407 domain-containing protein n=1 Tax=Mucilaginibacter lutimaris TaxID=931629 RepID=A0ABW2ZGH0_9SPHI